MGFFNFGKNKEENKPSCACGASNMKAEDLQKITAAFADANGVKSIKVLGTGCKSCHALHENVLEAVKELGGTIEAEYVSELEKIAAYGVMSMPALVINEKVVMSGKVLKKDEVKEIIAKMGGLFAEEK